MENNNNPIITDVKQLAVYVKNSYKEQYGLDISPLKLQKSLYFLFAYWGGFVRKNKQIKKNTPQAAEIDYSQYSDYLYSSNIEAWIYGPVLPDVYNNPAEIDNYGACKFEDIKEVKAFVDDLLKQIFKISDFRLVDISHADKVWKKYFNPTDESHNNIMPPEEIINEYASKI
jgi:uncharacterized phage-associated protein